MIFDLGRRQACTVHRSPFFTSITILIAISPVNRSDQPRLYNILLVR